MAIVTSLGNVNTIGDKILCKYTATTSGQVGYFSELGNTVATLIPVTSSATPDGSFYWAYVGKDYLGRKKFIADRNIQHSISWDALNNAGICSELNTNDFKYNPTIPKMTSDVMPSPYVAIGTQQGQYRYYAFDDNENTYTNSTETGNEWLGIDYGVGNEKSISKMTIRFYPGYVTTNGNIEASNDGINWTVIKSGLSFANDGSIQSAEWEAPTTKYRFWRLKTLISSYDGSLGGFLVYSMQFFEKIQNHVNLNFFIRLLTGGVSATDTDNEWDKIIVNSTLGGNITPGDNNVWNGISLWSWMSTTNSPNTSRTLRGYGNLSAWYAGASITTSYIAETTGFRPVLLIETLNINKFLLKKGDNYYTLKDTSYYDDINHVFMPLTLSGGTTPNEDDINSFGFENLSNLITPMTKGSDTFKPIDKFKSCEIKYYVKN